MEDCWHELRRISSLTRHFERKGTKLSRQGAIRCGYDDRFARKQCANGNCRCTNPSGGSIGAYQATIGQRETMDCRCALEESLPNNQGIDKLECDGEGNFKPVQCDSDGRFCHCTDSNGAAISDPFSTYRLQQFIDTYHGIYRSTDLCQGMRATLAYQHRLDDGKEFWYNAVNKTYDLVESEKIRATWKDFKWQTA